MMHQGQRRQKLLARDSLGWPFRYGVHSDVPVKSSLESRQCSERFFLRENPGTVNLERQRCKTPLSHGAIADLVSQDCPSLLSPPTIPITPWPTSTSPGRIPGALDGRHANRPDGLEAREIPANQLAAALSAPIKPKGRVRKIPRYLVFSPYWSSVCSVVTSSWIRLAILNANNGGTAFPICL
jgi:hypothetical protein